MKKMCLLALVFGLLAVGSAESFAADCDSALLTLRQRVCAADRVMKQQSGSDDVRGRFVAAMHGALIEARAACGRSSIRIDDAVAAAKSQNCGL